MKNNGLTEQRQIESYIDDPELITNKMVFLSGPRQIGKTTFSKHMLSQAYQGHYYNWDNPSIRRAYNENPFFFMQDINPAQPSLIVFDEIHKRQQWKDILKGAFDSIEHRHRIFVTGSARLNLFRQSGDSLVGRYTHFSLFPFSASELASTPLSDIWLCSKADWQQPATQLFERLKNTADNNEYTEHIAQLLTFGGFPEPLFRASQRFSFKWHQDYISLLLHEDLRDLTNIKNIDSVERMMQLLPERIGSPLSIASLARDVETSHPSIKNYLNQLKKLWLIFSIKPWSKNLARTVKKEEKVYFMDWAYCKTDAIIFENFLALQLYRACHIWTEQGWGKAKVFYVRDFDQKEVDFLITLNDQPTLLVEAKLSNKTISSSTLRFSKSLKVPILQVIQHGGIFKKYDETAWVISVDRFLRLLP